MADDLKESLKESKDIVDTLYDVNTLDYEDNKLYKRNIEHYDTYADYDEALEVYKELSHESFYPHVELCQVDVYEDGHRDYKVLKSTYGNELVEGVCMNEHTYLGDSDYDDDPLFVKGDARTNKEISKYLAKKSKLDLKRNKLDAKGKKAVDKSKTSTEKQKLKAQKYITKQGEEKLKANQQ